MKIIIPASIFKKTFKACFLKREAMQELHQDAKTEHDYVCYNTGKGTLEVLIWAELTNVVLSIFAMKKDEFI